MREVRAILLGLLCGRDLYGYQIKKVLEEPEFDSWARVPMASLYHELSRMTEIELIEPVAHTSSSGRPARTVFRITESGRRELAELLCAAWDTDSLTHAPQDIATFFIKFLPRQELINTLEQRLATLRAKMERVETEHRFTPPALVAINAHTRLRLQSEITWTAYLANQMRYGAFDQPNILGTPDDERTAVPKSNPVGAFTFVLHTHLPYCRMAGRWPHGEEWIHEALAETYIPLLNALYELREQRIPYRLTIDLTPVLVEQLADDGVLSNFALYLDREIGAAASDIARFTDSGQAQLEKLARYYHTLYTSVREAFQRRYSRDIVGAFRELQDEGYIEIVTCGATHGYLPLLERDSSVYAQIRAAVESYEQHFGRRPRAIWLPECAYRPAYFDDAGTSRPAIEAFLASQGIGVFFVETHAIQGGPSVGKAAGDVGIGPYSAVQRHYDIPSAANTTYNSSTFAPFYVVGSKQGLTDPPVAAIGRNEETGQQVWSAQWGYPGDFDYREFHRKDAESGLQYWRVTGNQVDLGAKDYYYPQNAAAKTSSHAAHFVQLVRDTLESYHQETGHYGLVCANYDTELFGHWWFEGVSWIKQVLLGLARSPDVDLVTASGFVDRHPPEASMALPESSWGSGGNHWTWDNPNTQWIWEAIHRCEYRMERLVKENVDADEPLAQALNQAARELLLLQASDWPFLITTGQAEEYARQRINAHLQRFEQLADIIDQGIDEKGQELIEELGWLDNVFPTIDYRWFMARQGIAT